MPSCPIYLTSANKILTGKELNYCRSALPHMELLHYYYKRHEWCQSTGDSVNWPAFQHARARNPHISSFISKLCAKALPTNAKLAQREGISPKCLLCGMEETNSHLWKCPHRQEWRHAFIHRYDQTLTQLGTNQDIKEHIIDQTTQYLNGSVERTIENPIGWDCMFLGFLPRDWSTNHDIPPTQWSSHIISFIWKEVNRLWKSRNDRVHHHTNNHRSLQEELRARTAIQAFYRYQHEIGPQDQEIFNTPWTVRMQTMSPKELLSWIRTMTPAVLTARTQHRTRSTLGTRDIRSYFTIPAA